jgi:hypothetical protein
MSNREIFINNITKHLSVLQHQVASRNSMKLLDINIHAEEFFRVLLNMIFNYELKNLNLGLAPSTAIDLADEKNRIAFQVTSDRSNKKIKDTVSKFYDLKLNETRGKLKILIVGEKVERREVIKHKGFHFDPIEDILDMPALVRTIQGQEIESIEKISRWLDSELNPSKNYSDKAPDQDDFDKYFLKFLNNDIDPDILLIKAQPNLADCKEIFSEEYYKDIYSIYSIHYYSILENKTDLSDKLRDKEIYRVKSSTYSDIKSGKHELPGGITKAFELTALRPGKHSFYSIYFTTKDSEHGISFKVWAFVNGRWVFFPQPWQVVAVLHELKSSKKIRMMVRVLKFFGLDKSVAKHDAEGAFATTFLLRQLVKDKN